MNEEVIEKPSGCLKLGLAALVILGVLFALNKMGMVSHKEEVTTWVDSKEAANRPDEFRPTKKEINKDTEATLQAIANRFAQGGRFSTKGQNEISKDEARFYNQLKDQNPLTEATEWLQLLRTGHNTYESIRGLLRQEDPQSNRFYEQLESQFGVDSVDIQSFTQEGEHLVSDWALWLMQQQ